MTKLNYDLIQKRKESLKLSYEEIAYKLGFEHRSTAQRIFNGDSKIDANLIPKLANILHINDMNDLFI